VANEDATSLVKLLAADVVVYADGGGKAPAFPRPVYGRERVARLLLASTSQGAPRLAVSGQRAVAINGQPGALLLDGEGRPVVAITLDILDDQVQAVWAISNPEKLHHVGAFLDRSGGDP
jgi:RNA polymerase sigma-70 factor, ECF subfamily